AAYLASRLTGVKFYAYLLDQFSHMLNYLMGATLFRHLERVMMKDAAAVIVPNEFLAHEVRAQFGIEPFIIHNSCDLDLYRETPDTRRHEEVSTIVFTGGISSLHFAAFRTLIEAIRLLERDD